MCGPPRGQAATKKQRTNIKFAESLATIPATTNRQKNNEFLISALQQARPAQEKKHTWESGLNISPGAEFVCILHRSSRVVQLWPILVENHGKKHAWESGLNIYPGADFVYSAQLVAWTPILEKRVKTSELDWKMFRN